VLLLRPLGYAGETCGGVAIAAGAIMIGLALRQGAVANRGEREPEHLFAYSIFYLFLLFATILLSANIGRLNTILKSHDRERVTPALRLRVSTCGQAI
jgi:heme O synthase-like polyprenyltransferase